MKQFVPILFVALAALCPISAFSAGAQFPPVDLDANDLPPLDPDERYDDLLDGDAEPFEPAPVQGNAEANVEPEQCLVNLGKGVYAGVGDRLDLKKWALPDDTVHEYGEGRIHSIDGSRLTVVHFDDFTDERTLSCDRWVLEWDFNLGCAQVTGERHHGALTQMISNPSMGVEVGDLAQLNQFGDFREFETLSAGSIDSIRTISGDGCSEIVVEQGWVQ